MAERARVKISNAGLYALRREAGVVADLEARIGRLKEACGRGYESSSQQGNKRPQGRWRTTVITATNGAIRDNARNNTLVNNLDALR